MFSLAFLRRKFGGTVFYCNITAGAPTGHDGDVIASDMGLSVPAAVRLILAVVAAGDVPHHPVLHVGDQRGVFQVQVSYQEVALPAHVLRVAFGVGGLVFLPDHLGRVGIGNVLALKAGHGRRVKDVFGPAPDLHELFRLAVQPDLPGEICLRAGAGDLDIAANQKALRRFRHVRAQFAAVVSDQSTSPLFL